MIWLFDRLGDAFYSVACVFYGWAEKLETRKEYRDDLT